MKELIDIKKNCITGIYGSCIDKLLDRIENRECEIIGKKEVDFFLI